MSEPSGKRSAGKKAVMFGASKAGPEGKIATTAIKAGEKAKRVSNKTKRSYLGGATIRSSSRGPQATTIKGYRRVLVGELLLCVIIVLLIPLAARNLPGKKVPSASDVLHRMVSVCAVFFILGIVTIAGHKVARVAAGIGGLVTLTLLVGKQDEIVYLFGVAANPKGGTAASPPLPQTTFSTQPGESSPWQDTPTVQSGQNPPPISSGEDYPINAGIPGFYGGTTLPPYNFTEQGARPVRGPVVYE